jgi:cytochrome P450
MATTSPPSTPLSLPGRGPLVFRRRNAPGPGPSALLDSLTRLQRDPYRLFLDLRRRYGPLVRLRLGPYLTHLVTDPEDVKHVLQDNNGNYVRGRMYESFKLFFGNGLLTNDGPAWQDHRRIVQPLFHKRRVEEFATLMTDETATLLDRWTGVARSADGGPLDVVPEVMHLSLNILGRVMFGTDLGRLAEEAQPAVRVCIRAMIFTGAPDELVPRWIPTPYNLRLRTAQRTLRGMVDGFIAAHRGQERGDLVGMLLAARDSQTGEPLPQEAVRDELMTIFLAGHETTGTALAWTLYLLGRHPAVCRTLEDELADVLGGRAPTLEDLPRLPYLRMVVDESLRLYPPIWLYPRDAVGDDDLGGYHIPARTSVFLSPYVTHRAPEYWDNPDACDPERFLPERSAGRPRYAYFPFGGGQRQCIGMHMAMLQLLLFTAMVAQRFRLHPVPGHPVSCGTLVSLRPLEGISMTIHERPGAR